MAPQTVTAVCECRNHRGNPKVSHPTKNAAIHWSLTDRKVRGLRLEFYRCPTTDAWHVRTARVRSAA